MSMMLVNRIDKKTIISWFIQMGASISDFGRHGILPPPAGPPLPGWEIIQTFSENPKYGGCQRKDSNLNLNDDDHD